MNWLIKTLSFPYRYLKYKTFKSAPIWVTFDVTSNCPCRCEYCNYWENKDENLSTDKLKTILKRLRETGVLYLGISGGEPMIRKDLPEIVRYAKSLGMIVGMNTSGIVAREEAYRSLMEAGIDTICFSIDGATAETHEKSRKIPVFSRTVQSIQMAVKIRNEEGFKTRINTSTVITKANLNELEEISHFREVLGVDRTNFQPVWEGAFNSVQLDAELGFKAEDRTLLEKVRDLLKGLPNTNFKKYLDLLPDFYTDYEGKVRPIECYAGRAFAYVTAQGVMYPCSILPRPLGSLLDEDPKEFLKTKKTRSILHQAASQGCKGCSLVCYMERNVMLNSLRNPLNLWEILVQRYLLFRSRQKGNRKGEIGGRGVGTRHQSLN